MAFDLQAAFISTLRNSRWGPFLDMWKELLQTRPTIPRLVEANGCHISFEMYGARNTHLVVYEKDLAVAVLFGVTSDAGVRPQHKLNLLDVPGTLLIGAIATGEDAVAKYAEIRAQMEQRNRPTEDDKLTGMEGAVWYVEEPGGRISLWKCKPESVEAIHWALGINKKAVIATCWNLLETSDDLRYETFLPMLAKEYELGDLKGSGRTFKPATGKSSRSLSLKHGCWECMSSLASRSIQFSKAGVTRALKRRFAKSEMNKL